MTPQPGRLGVFPLEPGRLGGALAHPVVPSSYSLTELAPVALWATNATGACVAMAGAWTRFTGRPPEAAAGEGWLAFVHDDDRASLKAMHLAATARREPYEVEVRYRRGDGAYRWVRIIGAPQLSEGEFRGFTGCAIDARRLRAQRQKAEHDLRAFEVLSELAWDALVVTDAEGRIVRTNAAALQLLGPDAVTGRPLADFVPDWAAVPTGVADEPPTLDVTRDDGSTLTTRVRVGRVGVEPDQSDTSDAFTVALRRVEPVPPGLERRDAGGGHDLGELAHELSNVVTALLAGCELARLDLPDGHPAHDELADISANVQRARDLTLKLKPAERGAAQRLAAIPSPGSLAASSVRDRSAGAFLSRPARRRGTPEPSAQVLRGLTVLVVDDEVSIRRSVRAAFEGAGAGVHDARHGSDALLMWSDLRGRVDLVVTDLRMPEMGGEELAERLRMLRRDLPILFVSGYALDRRVRRRPGDGFLSKPFNTEELLEAASRVVSQPGVGA